MISMAGYTRYALQEWEDDPKFILPDGTSWVYVAHAGTRNLLLERNQQDRGLVFCRLCQRYGRINHFTKGYRGGAYVTLVEHNHDEDHKLLVWMLEQGIDPDDPTGDNGATAQQMEAEFMAMMEARALALLPEPAAEEVLPPPPAAAALPPCGAAPAAAEEEMH